MKVNTSKPKINIIKKEIPKLNCKLPMSMNINSGTNSNKSPNMIDQPLSSSSKTANNGDLKNKFIKDKTDYLNLKMNKNKSNNINDNIYSLSLTSTPINYEPIKLSNENLNNESNKKIGLFKNKSNNENLKRTASQKRLIKTDTKSTEFLESESNLNTNKNKNDTVKKFTFKNAYNVKDTKAKSNVFKFDEKIILDKKASTIKANDLGLKTERKKYINNESKEKVLQRNKSSIKIELSKQLIGKELSEIAVNSNEDIKFKYKSKLIKNNSGTLLKKDVFKNVKSNNIKENTIKSETLKIKNPTGFQTSRTELKSPNFNKTTYNKSLGKNLILEKTKKKSADFNYNHNNNNNHNNKQNSNIIKSNTANSKTRSKTLDKKPIYVKGKKNENEETKKLFKENNTNINSINNATNNYNYNFYNTNSLKLNTLNINNIIVLDSSICNKNDKKTNLNSEKDANLVCSLNSIKEMICYGSINHSIDEERQILNFKNQFENRKEQNEEMVNCYNYNSCFENKDFPIDNDKYRLNKDFEYNQSNLQYNSISNLKNVKDVKDVNYLIEQQYKTSNKLNNLISYSNYNSCNNNLMNEKMLNSIDKFNVDSSLAFENLGDLTMKKRKISDYSPPILD